LGRLSELPRWGLVRSALARAFAAWGISLLWRYTPPEIRIANPEVTVTQNEALTVKQDKPFTIQQPDPLKIDPAVVTIKQEPSSPAGSTMGNGGQTTTATGDVIKHKVTVFWTAVHEPGEVVTGWEYPDGRGGGVPVREYCYYLASSGDGSSKKVDIAVDRVQSMVIVVVPDLQGARKMPVVARRISSIQPACAERNQYRRGCNLSGYGDRARVYTRALARRVVRGAYGARPFDHRLRCIGVTVPLPPIPSLGK
jgi:hypothetical protein